MCGIAGRFHPAGLPPDPSWHDKADKLLAHRGPDGTGYYADVRCELVHRRLALIDLSPTGRQPMANETGSIQIIFNGEIYNHRELRADLKRRGHAFRGTSDCEVLPHLYEEHGDRMVGLVRGMYAFALYDRDSSRLLLVRDRFGIKPLYYTVLDGGYAFASEIKALLALQGIRTSIDRQACYDFLGLGYVPEPTTAFSEIRALPAGTALSVGKAGGAITRYHQIRAQPDFGRDLGSVVEDLAQRLPRVVEEQLVADVPVAALLSGGIDSSLVVAASSSQVRTPLRTFNVLFPDKEFDETAFADATSAHCGTRHETIPLTHQYAEVDQIVRLMLHFDQPFADTSLIPTYEVCRIVRERGLICALSGDGGDEAFGGYGPFWIAPRLWSLGGIPRPLQSLVAWTGDRLGGALPNWGRRLARGTRIARAANGNMSVLLAGMSNYLSEAEKEELVLPPAREALEPAYRLYDGRSSSTAGTREELSSRLTENLFSLSLASDMLRKVDMMSMLASIEVRVPLLDEGIVDLGLALPHALKTDGRQGKLVLRKLAERWLPQSVARHRKMGFRIPLDRLLPINVHEVFADYLLSPTSRTRSILNPTVVGRWISLFKRSQQGAADKTISREGLYQRMMFLLALENWMRQHKLSW